MRTSVAVRVVRASIAVAVRHSAHRCLRGAGDAPAGAGTPAARGSAAGSAVRAGASGCPATAAALAPRHPHRRSAVEATAGSGAARRRGRARDLGHGRCRDLARDRCGHAGCSCCAGRAIPEAIAGRCRRGSPRSAGRPRAAAAGDRSGASAAATAGFRHRHPRRRRIVARLAARPCRRSSRRRPGPMLVAEGHDDAVIVLGVLEIVLCQHRVARGWARRARATCTFRRCARACRGFLRPDPCSRSCASAGFAPCGCAPRPRRFCCPCLIGSVLGGDEKS